MKNDTTTPSTSCIFTQAWAEIANQEAKKKRTAKAAITKQIKALDVQYILIWAQMQDFPKGSKQHKELQKQFLSISAELVKLKKAEEAA